MITMEMLGKGRRTHMRDRFSLREISKRSGLSRNPLRKWLRKQGEDVIAPPRYQRGGVPNKLSSYHAELEQSLKNDALRIKRNRRGRKALFLPIKAADGYACTAGRRLPAVAAPPLDSAEQFASVK